MIEENKFGFRDKRGHFVPKEAADKNPLWILPLNLKKIFGVFMSLKFIMINFINLY